MLDFKRTLICVLFVISIFEPITAGRGKFSGFGGGRHSYPSGGGRSGLSGGGHHSYPSSGGLSGTGSRPQSHGYPSSGSGLSGGGGSHSYPSSGGGLSGSGSRPQSHGYPSGGSSYNKYPSSGNTQHTTTVHHHYHYSPPQQIRYAGSSGAMSYPVYRGAPPTYVYQYKNSGSKYGTLLAGLALFNLGALAGGVYGYSQGHHSSYKPQPGEVCKFGLRKDNGDYEETKIDCQIITSFIFQSQGTAQNNPSSTNTTVTSTTVTNVTTVNAVNPVVGTEVMLPNGTLVMTNATAPAANSTVTVTTTTTNTTTNALDVKGDPIKLSPNMKCYVIRTTPTQNMRKTIDCGLLQTYADQSLRRNSAVRNIPTFTIVTAMIAAFVMY